MKIMDFPPQWLRTLLLLGCVLYSAKPYKMYQDRLPNGDMVPHPCKANFIWKGVGHENALGGGSRNQFGIDFANANREWTKVLCQKDSDGDGLTNGEELGDPDCEWKIGDTPKTSLGLSHPGVCSPFNAAKCRSQNKWVDCSHGDFLCDALKEPDMKNITVRIPETEVPNTETNYYCMIFDLPSDDDYHLVATEPYIDNTQVMHHILIFGCDESEKEIPENELNQATSCRGMAPHPQCIRLIGGWTVGGTGHCVHKDVGFRIGRSGYRKAAYQFHWNNPELQSGYKDSSGLTLFYTANRRVNDAVSMMVGQEYIEIPPGKQEVVVKSKCSSECTSIQLTGPVYITEAFNHMHYMGRSQQIELYRNGQKLRDITNDPNYNYDIPSFNTFETPIEVRPGDDIITTCKFKSVGKSKTTFKGDGTSDEMCYGFFTIYPAQNMPIPYCVDWKSVPVCKAYFYRTDYDEIDGCKWKEYSNSSHPVTQTLIDEVEKRCRFWTCLEECKNYVKTLKQTHPCMHGDINYFIRETARDKAMHVFFARLDSCDNELKQKQCMYEYNTAAQLTSTTFTLFPLALITYYML